MTRRLELRVAVRRGIRWAVSLLLWLAPSASVVATERPTPVPPNLIVERPEEDVLLLSLRLDSSVLADTLPAWQDEGRILVPFGEICRLLGFGIEVDVSRGLASGFFLSDTRRFELAVNGQRVLVEGKRARFDPRGVEVHEDDLYVDTALISEWLPINLDVDLYGALIIVRPREPLPLQLRLAREGKLERSRARSAVTASHFPPAAEPYQWGSVPFMDLSLKVARQPGLDGGGSNSAQYSTYATGDLLFLTANAYASGNDSGLSDARLTLGRKDPAGGLLGLLGAREAAVGDVFYPGLDLIASPTSGSGLLLSNFPLQLPAQFDRQSFRGDLPPGWEVELYRGEELLAYAQSRADGLYEFLNVPLLFGVNLFRLELYGPQGQRRSETQVLNVDQSLTPPGKVYYRLVGSDPTIRLVGDPPGAAAARASFELSAGISHHLSASASVANVSLADGRHNYGKLGLRGYWGSLFANLDVAADRDGGSAARATLQSRLGAFSVFAGRTQLRDFVSEAFGSAGAALRSRTTLRVDTAIPASFLPRLPISMAVTRDVLTDGGVNTQWSGRLSAFRRGLSIANELRWLSTSGPGGGSSSAYGQLLVSRYLQHFSLRGEVDYAIEPLRQLTSAELTAESRLNGGYLVSAGVSRQLQSGQTRIRGALGRFEGPFGWSLAADYSHPGGFGASLLGSVGLGRDPRGGQWYHQARPMAGGGAASARAFLDANGNGAMDGDEEPIPDVGFRFNGGGEVGRTDAAGVAFIPNLAPYQAVDLAIATSSLEDPYWRPALEGVRLEPRPGAVARVEFPVVVSGEVTGTVRVRRGGIDREMSGIDLELVDTSGRVVGSARTAYDGFYDLAEIAPGRYSLRVAPAQAERLELASAPTRQLEMQAGGSVLDGIDFLLEATEPEQALSVVGPPIHSAASVPATAPGPQSPVPAPPVPATLPAARFGVQVSSTRAIGDAERTATRMAERLRQPATVVAADLGADGRWFRVVVGEATTAAAASELSSVIVAAGVAVGPVIRLPERQGPLPGGLAGSVSMPAPFSVQVAAYQVRQRAEEDAASLRGRLGLPVTVVAVDLGPQGRWFRVLVGELATREAAVSLGQRLERELAEQPVIRRNE